MQLFDVYPLFDIEPVKAKGSYIWDKKGEKYLDLYGGHAVISIGHGHPEYVSRLSAQLSNIGFYSNSVKIPLQEEVAEKLGKLSGYSDYQLFLCNSGAEANENALKIASFENGRTEVIAFSKSFHGRTSAAVAATDDPSLSAAINKHSGFRFLPLNDLQALEEAISDKTCAVIVEGMQGVGGVRVPSSDFLQKIRELCDQTGAVMILDEVQSGYGRSGKFFAHQYAEVKPDLITIAKGMGNGFPVAGVLIAPKFKAKHGMLGTTFGGNYLACAAAKAVLDVIEAENLVENARNLGDYLSHALWHFDMIKEVRGCGLMIGIEFHIPCLEIRNMLLQEFKIFTGGSSDKNTLRVLPPLNISKEEIDLFIKALEKIQLTLKVPQSN